MSHYAISVSPDEASHEFRVVLRGPGIDSDGRRYVFRNTYRCKAFVEAVNFAYEQGLRDGLLRGGENGRLLFVSGTTPDNMVIRPEGRWAQFKRRWFTSHSR